MTPAERVLRDAAAYIRRWGWMRGPRIRSEMQLCMMNAVGEVCHHSNSSYGEAYDVLQYVVGGIDPVVFNDRHCQSADDAIAALLIAADLAAEPWEGP